MTSVGDELAASRNVTVILRLVLDAQGDLVRGDLVEVDGSPWRHFTGWQGLTGALQDWLLRRQRAAESPRGAGDRPGG